MHRPLSEKEVPSEQMQFRVVELMKQRVGTRRMQPNDFLHTAAGTASSATLHVLQDHILNSLVYELFSYVIADTRDSQTLKQETRIEYPASPWEYFKSRHMPAWFTKRYPVQRHCVVVPQVVINRKVTRACPHVMLPPDHHGHVRFVIGDAAWQQAPVEAVDLTNRIFDMPHKWRDQQEREHALREYDRALRRYTNDYGCMPPPPSANVAPNGYTPPAPPCGACTYGVGDCTCAVRAQTAAQLAKKCHYCGGEGEIIFADEDDFSVCPYCSGTGAEPVKV